MRILMSLTALAALSTMGLSSTIYVPDDHPTIQGAIDAAVNGDTVIVRPGTYVENIDFVGKAITVKSEKGASVTTIDGNSSDSVVTFQSGEPLDSVLDGFTVMNGSAVQGGGICSRGTYSSQTIVNNIIERNAADNGGGICCCAPSGAAIITDNIIWENRADNEGAGIYIFDSSSMTITNNTISENAAIRSGGGIHSVGSSFPLIITNNTISGNTAHAGGGGISFFAAPDALIANNIISNNSTSHAGGGLEFNGTSSATIVTNNIISQNWADSVGCGGGIDCSSSSPVITNNLISENLVYFAGGGINCGNDSSPIITNNTITGNWADEEGGGISCRSDCAPSITNNTISENASGIRGGAISCWRDCNPTVTNTILWNNQAPTGKEVWISYSSNPSSLTIGNSDVDGGQSSCHVEPGSALNWGPGMIDDDPRFVDSSNNDYHLTWHSPCRDAGDSNAVTEIEDFEGDPRIVHSTVDMGADEIYYHLYHIGDVTPGGIVDLKIVGYPQAPVTLAWGQTILDPPLSTQHGDLYISPFVWSGGIGNISSSGVLNKTVTIPPGWSSGDHAPLQALIGPWGGNWAKLTNLEIVTVE